jgi:hypothetical protein
LFGSELMFKSKHVITALIVTPILSLIGYFAADYYVSERPQQAKAGESYQLVQLPNCRYASGKCVLKNGDFKVVITGDAEENGGLYLRLESEFALDDVYVSVVPEADTDEAPMQMKSLSDDRKNWQVSMFVPNAIEQSLRLVVTTDGAVYYAESGMPFLNYETSFNKDFRKQE